MRLPVLALACALACGAGRALAVPPPPASSLSALIQRGDGALAAGDSISAITFYREAVQRAPRDARGYLALGRAYLQVDEPRHALEAFEVGARSSKGDTQLTIGLAETYARLGRHDQALAALRGALVQGAPSAALLEALAERAEAAAAFSEALAARRALLARARAEQGPEQLRGYETRVRALELLLGAADRVGRSRCAEADTPPLLRLLLDCAARGP